MGVRRAALGFAVTLLFLVLLARQVDAGRVLESLRGADYALVLAAVPFYFAGVWFRVLRWQQLLAPVVRLPARALFSQVVIGYMANDVLPLRAGELVRAYLLGRRFGVARAPVLGTIALERITDGLALLALAAVITLVVPVEGWMAVVLRTAPVLFLGAALGTLGLLYARDRLIARMEGWSPLARAGLRLLGSFMTGTESLRQPGRLARVGLHAVLAWLFEACVFYLAGAALGLAIPFWLCLLAMAMANLATALPSSQAGIGPFEYFAAQTLAVFGTDPTLAATFALLVHAVLILPVTLLGFVYLWRDHLSLGDLTASPKAGDMVAKPVRGVPVVGEAQTVAEIPRRGSE